MTTGFEDEFLCDGGAADQFDHDVGFADRLRRVGGQHPFRDLHAAVSGDVEVRNAGEDQLHVRALGDHVAVPENIGGDSGPDRAESDDSYFDFFHDSCVPVLCQWLKILLTW